MLPISADKKKNSNPFYIFISFVLVVSACVTPPQKVQSLKMPISKSESCIKQHGRIRVYANRPPWTKTNINIDKGDKVIVFASGVVTTGKKHQNKQPYNLLQMKIGKAEIPESALSVNNQRYFEPTEYGELMFAVHDW